MSYSTKIVFFSLDKKTKKTYPCGKLIHNFYAKVNMMPQEQVIDHKALWKKILDRVRLDISDKSYHSFFKDTKLVKIQNSTAEISCHNSGVGFVLQNKYQQLITEGLSQYYGQKINRLLFSSEQVSAKTNPGPLFVKRTLNKEDLIAASGIMSGLSFDNFAVSVSNQMAHAAAQGVAINPGTQYNPLFIWGGVGVGKTHLLSAIGRKTIENNRARVLLCSAEDFTNSLVEAIKNKKTDLFRKKFRQLDVFLLDDVQFISEREFVQEELFYTFNKLRSLNKQVVLAADKPPRFLNKIEKRLVSRFLSGLVVDIQPPDFELKTAIILIKAQEKQLDLDIETAKILSSNLEEIREVEGFLLTLEAMKRAGIKINRDAVEKKLLQNSSQKSLTITPKEIINAVCLQTKIRLKDIRLDNRKKQVVLARHLIMYFLKTINNLSYEDIARLLEKKDHTTVMHAVSKIINQIPKDEALRRQVETIKNYLS